MWQSPHQKRNLYQKDLECPSNDLKALGNKNGKSLSLSPKLNSQGFK
jgi:hypothetical protein